MMMYLALGATAHSMNLLSCGSWSTGSRWGADFRKIWLRQLPSNWTRADASGSPGIPNRARTSKYSSRIFSYRHKSMIIVRIYDHFHREALTLRIASAMSFSVYPFFLIYFDILYQRLPTIWEKSFSSI